MAFSLATPGSAAPASKITLDPAFEASALAVDHGSGVVYVGGIYHGTTGASAEVLAYSAGVSGTPTPARTIAVANADFAQPLSMTVDSTGQLYVASVVGLTPTVTVFPASANGPATPVRSLAGASTGMYLPSAIAVDAAGNLYVSSIYPVVTPYGGSIVEFAPGALGNVPPKRSITSIDKIFNGVAVDSTGNVWAVEETDNNGVYSNPSLVEFDATASGAAVPMRTISGAATMLGTVGEVQVDSKNNVFVVEQSPSGGAALLGFGPNATGNVQPDYTLTPPALTSGSPQFDIR